MIQSLDSQSTKIENEMLAIKNSTQTVSQTIHQNTSGITNITDNAKHLTSLMDLNDQNTENTLSATNHLAQALNKFRY